MPPWPKSRVTVNPPFFSIGLDYFGPAWLTGREKIWVLILTCLSTRAIHLEAVQSLSSEDFLLAFRKFVSRRGCPSEILSDNAPQFYLAKNTLDMSPNFTVQWKFITAFAPWEGSVYERLIGIIKPRYRRALGRKLLNLWQFTTFTAEVEAIVNSRPITFVSDEKDGTIALRPMDFLLPRATACIEEPDESEPAYHPGPAEKLARLWYATNKALREFWETWSSQYLILLRNRTQDQHKRPMLVSQETPQVGHIVLIEQEDMARNDWPLGRIIKLIGPPMKNSRGIISVWTQRHFGLTSACRPQVLACFTALL